MISSDYAALNIYINGKRYYYILLVSTGMGIRRLGETVYKHVYL